VIYNVLFSGEARTFIRTKIPPNHIEHVKEVIELCLGKYLHTPSKRGNAKPLKGTNPQKYRLHISMTYTVIYQIDEEEKTVIIDKIMGINQAHSKYNIA